MKKTIVLSLMVTFFTVTFNMKANAQKAGILQISHYGLFTGAQWEGFLNRENAVEFEKYSNIKLFEFLDNFVTPYVKDQLKEASIASAMDNSTMEQFPAGADVLTMNSEGEWKKRTVRPGESGFFHHPTGIYWLSFSCGNLMSFGPGPKIKGTSKTDPALMVNTGNPQTGGNSNTLTFTPPAQNQSSELTWNVDYGAYSMGRNDRQNDFIVDASLFKMIQDGKECCKQTAPATVVPTQVVYSQPAAMYASAQPAVVQQQGQTIVYSQAQQKLGFGQTFGGQLLANFGGEVLATYAVRGIDALAGRGNVRYNNTFYNPNQNMNRTLFQGSSVLEYNSTGLGNNTGLGREYRNDAFIVR